MKQPDNKKKKRRQYPMQKGSVPALDCVAHEPVLNDYGTLRSIDLFAGAGGLSEGLSMAGFVPLFASELVDSYARTYQLNHPRTEVRSADIRSLDPKAIMKQMGVRRGELDLIAGGPPCQGFSINAPVRSVLDQRNHLFKEYLRFVDAFQPRAVLI